MDRAKFSITRSIIMQSDPVFGREVRGESGLSGGVLDKKEKRATYEF
jgi:hypothetical protein